MAVSKPIRGTSLPAQSGRIKKILSFAFFAIVGYLIVNKARAIAWHEVLTALGNMERSTLSFALVASVASFFLYSCYDVLSKNQISSSMPARNAMLAAAISYAVNLNLGALIGGIAFRFRLYSRFGFQAQDTARLVAFSVLTNWLGHIFILSLLLMTPSLFDRLNFPTRLADSPLVFRGVGVVLFSVVLLYFGLCRFSPKRRFTVFRQTVHLPSIRMAVLQVALASLSWLSIGSIIFILFRGQLTFFEAEAILLLSGLAAAAVHVPAGLGIIEAVFLQFLAGRIPESEILAALFAYRAIYYLLPLVLALLAYGGLEWRTRRHPVSIAETHASWLT